LPEGFNLQAKTKWKGNDAQYGGNYDHGVAEILPYPITEGKP